MIFVVNYHIVRAMSDLSVHPYHEFFVMRFDNPVSITVETGSPDKPSIRCDPLCIFVVDYCCSRSAGNKGTIENFLGFSVYFYEH